MTEYNEGDIVRYIKIERKVVAEGPLVRSMDSAEFLFPEGYSRMPFTRYVGKDEWNDYEIELVERAKSKTQREILELPVGTVFGIDEQDIYPYVVTADGYLNVNSLVVRPIDTFKFWAGIHVRYLPETD